MKKVICMAALVLLAASYAMADRQVDRTVPARADAEVSIELLAGTLEIIGWDRKEVRVTGTIGDDIEDLEIDSDGGDVSIEIEIDEGSYDSEDSSMHTRTINNADVRLEVRVPHGSSLDIEAISAGVEVEGVRGRIESETISGDIEIRGEVISAEIANISGSVRATASKMFRSGEFETVSGNIVLDGAFAPDGRFDFEAVSGKIVLNMPAGTSAEFDVETFSGSIDNDFGMKPDTSPFLPSKSLEFSTGGGGAQISIETISGSIQLNKK